MEDEDGHEDYMEQLNSCDGMSMSGYGNLVQALIIDWSRRQRGFAPLETVSEITGDNTVIKSIITNCQKQDYQGNLNSGIN